MKKSGTVIRRDQSDSPAARHLPLVDILVDAQAELQALVVASGLKVLEAMLEEDRVAVCGPRYTHQPHLRRASRAGHARPARSCWAAGRWRFAGRGCVVTAARSRCPRSRPLRTRTPSTGAWSSRCSSAWRRASMTGVWNRWGPDVRTRGTSKSAVSRRFVAQTQGAVGRVAGDAARRPRSGGATDRRVQVGGHCIVVALGHRSNRPQTRAGPVGRLHREHDGLSGLADQPPQPRTPHRSQPARDPRWGEGAPHGRDPDLRSRRPVQRCQVHKRRNVLEYLPEAQRVWVKAILTRAYTRPDVKAARRLLHDLARRLDADYPSAAASVREGLDETLTVIGLGLSARLQRSLATTNAVESLLSRTRHVKHNVKALARGSRWSSGGSPLACWKPPKGFGGSRATLVCRSSSWRFVRATPSSVSGIRRRWLRSREPSRR